MLDLLGGGVDLLLALLTATTEAEDEVKSALLLDVVVGEGAAILELLASEDQALLVRGDTLLVCVLQLVSCRSSRRWRWMEAPAEEEMRTLDLGLDIVNGVGRLHLEGDSLARKGLHENLHDGDLDSGVVVVLSREEKEVARNVRFAI